MPVVGAKKVKKIEPVKQAEFDMFCHILEQGQGMHLYKIGELLGVAPETISNWKKDPRAREAYVKGLTHNLGKMQEVGGADWRMYEKNLALAGMIETKKTDVTTGGEKLNLSNLSDDDLLAIAEGRARAKSAGQD